MLSYICKILFETILTKMQIRFVHTFSNILFHSNNLFMPVNLFLSYFCASAKPVFPETSDSLKAAFMYQNVLGSTGKSCSAL